MGGEMAKWRESQDFGRRLARFFSRSRPDNAVPRRFASISRWIAALLVLVGLITLEVRNSWLQSIIFSHWAESMTFHLEQGPSPAIHFPEHGPFDTRRGYTQLPAYLRSLDGKGYQIKAQARTSAGLRGFQSMGGFPPYHERSRAGLTLLSAEGRPYYAVRFPGRTYKDFSQIPAPVRDALLFIENRELLDPDHPRRNPAVEWDRLWLAMFSFGASEAMGGSRPGGSTLATQIEKFRHSPDGRTTGAVEKLRQMVSASLRAYSDGPETTGARKRILLTALNSMPLAAVPGHGEVIGLGDGLRLWYGADFDRANQLLRAPADTATEVEQKALAFKQVLSLLIAQRRPSYFLRQGQADLEKLTDSYVRLMASSGIIDADVRDAALRTPLRLHSAAPEPVRIPTDMTKAASGMRITLLNLLGMSSLYELDRLDLTAQTTLDAQAQARITAVLRSLNEPENISALGLVGPRLLQGTQPARVAYSFALFERHGTANLLRVQADSLDQPLDLNVGTKMELGSTAKVRTLITYLEIIADQYQAFRAIPRSELERIAAGGDPLSQWVAQQLLDKGDVGLRNMLQAAMDRTYSSSPGERFFTAGGAHRFSNFGGKFGGKLTVTKALEQSVNLVFIRIMRDIVDYEIARLPGAKGIIDDPNHPLRRVYLTRFADKEGQQYLWRFYPQYKHLGREAILARIAERAKYLRPRLAASYRTVLPNAGYEEFAAFINRWATAKVEDEGAMRRLYETYATDRLNLADRSYVASIHPLELWLAGYLYAHPNAAWKDIVAASADVRQESYGWLFRPNRVAAQNRRIRVLLEQEAFVPIHSKWQRLGYPFGRLVPSYATAIGTSGDRPDALAELMGIIVNNGVRLPVVRVERLRFAEATPYETVVETKAATGRQVLRPEIAAVVRGALVDVVENGTARRASGALKGPDGAPLLIGAKTGTGDNRTQQFGRGGRVIGSTVRSRTATLIFFIGDRFFGTITAHVDGPGAVQYRFTSALPAQLFKSLAPVIQPLVDRSYAAQGEIAGARNP